MFFARNYFFDAQKMLNFEHKIGKKLKEMLEIMEVGLNKNTLAKTISQKKLRSFDGGQRESGF